jgi:predicted AAA+ superfamily ATPase
MVGDEGAKFENLVACALLKELHSLEDLKGKNTALHYLKTKEGKEVDFLVTIERKPKLMIDVKWSDGKISPNLIYFKDYFRERKINPDIRAIQLVAQSVEERSNAKGVEIRNAIHWPKEMPLMI